MLLHSGDTRREEGIRNEALQQRVAPVVAVTDQEEAQQQRRRARGRPRRSTRTMRRHPKAGSGGRH